MKLSWHSVRQSVGIALLSFAGTLAAQVPSISLPLHTKGDRIVDRQGHSVSLFSVNWYGFDQKDFVAGGLDRATIDQIVDQIVAMGFNSVRLPWANETIERNVVVAPSALAANPSLIGKRSVDLMDTVITALTKRHIMVILDNHMSDADWCCKADDALWYNDAYDEQQWISDWQAIVRRYAGNSWVIGADLRNELRGAATWGGDNPKTDWRKAAIRGGNAVLAVNPELLIFVEGPKYSTQFTDVAKKPIKLRVPHRLVISPHAYSIGHTYKDYDEAAAALHREFDPLLRGRPRLPIWVGEFGNCTSGSCALYGEEWLRWFARFCTENGVRNVSYWALNATQSTGSTRVYGKPESYGLLTSDWSRIRSPEAVHILQSITLTPTGQVK